MRLLPNAEFVSSDREWRAATASRAITGGYVARHLPERSRMRLIDLDRDGTSDGPFARTVDLLGDGQLSLVSTPGHTPGHLSVRARLPDTPEVMIVGDAAYTRRSIDEQLLPARCADDELARRSLRELKAYADARPEALVIPTHDPQAWQTLAAAVSRRKAREVT